jgi:hypothetical protein
MPWACTDGNKLEAIITLNRIAISARPFNTSNIDIVLIKFGISDRNNGLFK